MKASIQRDDRLVIADSPALIWLLASLFLFVGLLAISIPALLSPEHGLISLKVSRPVQVAVVAAGVLFLSLAIRSFYRSPASTGVFDKVSRKVTISRRRVFCPPMTSTHDFAEVASAILVEKPDPQGGTRTEILLTLSSGQKIHLSELQGHDHEEAMAAQRAIQSFMFSQEKPSSVIVH